MINTFKTLFQDSPLFVALMDDTLICREINEIWRNYLNLSATDTVTLSVEELFDDLHHESALISQIEQVAHKGHVIKEIPATLLAKHHATQILGWRGADVIDKPLHDIHHHSYPDGSPYPSSECPIYAAIKDGKVHHGDDEVFWHTNGTAVPVEYTSTPIRGDNTLKGAVVIFRDITERKKNEQQRETAYEQIKILNDLLEHERDYLRDEINITINFGEIIGESQALKRTLAQIEAVAKMPTSVLILGESGVGKEMVARAIHANSARADKQLVKVNCASIPKNLFESEFFGHVRGSFTGAHRDRVGRFHLAAGGTLFLDEIGKIPLDLQGKLLRVLQEHEFERVGDDKTIKIDVRIIAATNRNLKAALPLREARWRYRGCPVGKRRVKEPRTPGQGWTGWALCGAGKRSDKVRAIERVRGMLAHPGGNQQGVRGTIYQSGPALPALLFFLPTQRAIFSGANRIAGGNFLIRCLS